MLQDLKDIYSSFSIYYQDFEAALADERPRLVRFCAHMTGSVESAEDLAQETLLEAWRNQHKLREPFDEVGRAKWLTTIARNVCLRWLRSRGRDLSHLIPLPQSATDEDATELADLPAQDEDIEIQLEREELAELLDRAMTLLPPETRDVLIERFIHNSPYAEIAQRLQVSQESLMQRIYRGKLALRRVITTHMSEEAATYGLITPEEVQLNQETRIWCPMCSQARLIKHDHPQLRWISFDCPICGRIAAHYNSHLWAGVHSPKSILARLIASLETRYWSAINTLEGACDLCGHPLSIRIYPPQDMPLHRYLSGDMRYASVSILCSSCGNEDINPLPHLMLDTPEAQKFYRKHPRIFWQPGQEIEYQGQPARVGSFRDARDQAVLTILSHRDTLKVLGTHESSR